MHMGQKSYPGTAVLGSHRHSRGDTSQAGCRQDNNNNHFYMVSSSIDRDKSATEHPARNPEKGRGFAMPQSVSPVSGRYSGAIAILAIDAAG